MGSIRDKIIADQTRLSAEKPWAAAVTKDFTKFDTGAQKEVEGKLRMDLIPPEVEKAYAEVLTFGVRKYDDRNWQKGIPYMSCVAALKRHLNSWLLKEDINEESGFNHVKHVLFWAAALTYFVENANLELDDR